MQTFYNKFSEELEECINGPEKSGQSGAGGGETKKIEEQGGAGTGK